MKRREFYRLMPAEARKSATDHGWRVLAVGELKDAT